VVNDISAFVLVVENGVESHEKGMRIETGSEQSGDGREKKNSRI
jgi:hypothetical protein